jgi:hypothetical protein
MKIKADDFVQYENEENGETCKFTYFEELQKRVEVLQETIDEITAILRANNLNRREVIEAPYFDEEKVFEKLDEVKK